MTELDIISIAMMKEARRRDHIAKKKSIKTEKSPRTESRGIPNRKRKRRRDPLTDVCEERFVREADSPSSETTVSPDGARTWTYGWFHI
ncbi:UNVERIFIED_CONTAM: hypothetical protein K2H54_042133 [Gekko kuhli]